jgi:hypothetical protein
LGLTGRGGWRRVQRELARSGRGKRRPLPDGDGASRYGGENNLLNGALILTSAADIRTGTDRSRLTRLVPSAVIRYVTQSRLSNERAGIFSGEAPEETEHTRFRRCGYRRNDYKNENAPIPRGRGGGERTSSVPGRKSLDQNEGIKEKRETTAWIR